MMKPSTVLYLGGILPETIREDNKTITKELETLFLRRPHLRSQLYYHLNQAYAFRTYVGDNYSHAGVDLASTTSAYVFCYLKFEPFFEPNQYLKWEEIFNISCYWYYTLQNDIPKDDSVRNKSRIKKELREYFGEREKTKRLIFGSVLLRIFTICHWYKLSFICP